ncbi:MAG TPA: alcohol dehydrogenase catalytic domain-containing protein [Thermoplasmata archaeon]|nr:alcohol dehydrogenase catalytic domain-containing protein [Thermoplasmata archaeon]
MRAVRFEADGSIRSVNVPVPQVEPDDVLVQVLAAGVCRTDLHLMDEVRFSARPPLIPGHEIAGRVTKVGSDVYLSKAGDLVAVHFEQPCGQCRQCRRKRTNLCRDGHSLGFDVQGGYAEHVKARQDTVLPLPADMDPALAAPLGCSGATAYRAVVALGNAGEEDLVVVLGAGGVGLSAVQIAKSQGARVVVVDPREDARNAALDAGAESAVPPEEAKDVHDADVVVDFVGRDSTLILGRSLLGVGGRYVAVAGGSEPVPMTATDIMEYGRAYLGSYSSTMADLARVVSLAEAGRLRPVVTRRAPLEEAGSVLQDLRDGKIVGRAVLEPTAV